MKKLMKGEDECFAGGAASHRGEVKMSHSPVSSGAAALRQQRATPPAPAAPPAPEPTPHRSPKVVGTYLVPASLLLIVNFIWHNWGVEITRREADIS